MFKLFKGKGRSRNPTRSFVTPAETRSALPPAPQPERPAESAPPAPSYAHADQQHGVVDTTAEARQHEDDATASATGRNPADTQQPTTTIRQADKRRATGSEVQGTAGTSSAVSSSAMFNRFWKLRLTDDLDEEIFSGINSYIPNTLAMFAILRESGMYAYDNYVMLKRHPDYLDYAVVCYYSIIFYIQILRAQQAAGKLSGGDRSFLNRFKDKFPYESLPVSSILFPFFSTIVATLPTDVKYDWIIPTYAADMFKRSYSGNFTTGDGGCFIQPQVPYMLRILRQSFTRTTISAISTDSDDYFDDQERYITHAFADDAVVTFCGATIRQNTARTDDRNTVFSACGVRHPFFANINQLTSAAPFMRRSKFNSFPYVTVNDHDGMRVDSLTPDNGTTWNANARQTGTGHLDEFLEMGKFADTEFFFELVRQASLHARFFEESKSLSDVPTTSGNEPLIGCKFRKVTNGRHVSDVDTHLGLQAAAATTPHWYPSTFEGYVGSFYTSRAGVSRQETLQAMSFGTQGSINVTYTGGHRVGDGPSFLIGDYWANKQWTYSRFRDMNLSRNGVEMFKGWNTMFQEDAALEKPTGY
nr:capsid protein [Sarcosphaera coronaria partitivirus]